MILQGNYLSIKAERWLCLEHAEREGPVAIKFDPEHVGDCVACVAEWRSEPQGGEQ